MKLKHSAAKGLKLAKAHEAATVHGAAMAVWLPEMGLTGPRIFCFVKIGYGLAALAHLRAANTWVPAKVPGFVPVPGWH